jgi:O-antigen ligase
MITAALIYFTPQGFSTAQRISNLVKIEYLGFGDDAAIITRVGSYKLSWQMFTERPLIGYGFGSFNGYNNIEWTTIQKYPHNIFLEILSEMGLIGALIFGIIFYQIIRSIYNLEFRIYNSKSNLQPPPSHLLILLAFSLWMAMFSKDISTQGFLWLFLAAYSIPQSSIQNQDSPLRHQEH